MRSGAEALHARARGRPLLTPSPLRLFPSPTSRRAQVLDLIAGIDDPRKAVDILVAEAGARWMKEEQVIDDTTVIVAFLDVPPLPGAR